MVQTKQALTFVAVTGPLQSPRDRSPRSLIPSAGSRTQQATRSSPGSEAPAPASQEGHLPSWWPGLPRGWGSPLQTGRPSGTATAGDGWCHVL